MRPQRLVAIAFALLAACGGTGGPSARGASQASAAPVSNPEPKLVAVDIFGASQAVMDRLINAQGSELRRFGEAMMRDDETYDGDAMIDAIRAAGDFVSVEPALIGYFEDAGMKYYLTIDVVERSDAARRLAFSPPPTGEHADPEGLIADWQMYEAKVMELTRTGEMSPARVDCPAFHCLGDHRHAAVAPLVERFRERVPHEIDALVEVLREDGRSEQRGAAAYLLAFMSDGHELVRLLIPSLRDESSFVRNSAMRVLADIAFHHPELEIPIEPVLEALDFPATTDRNKAAAIVAGLLERPDGARYQRAVVERAGPTLIAMLRLKQPNNHDFAYEILKRISSKTFGERDYAAWEKWLRSVRPAQ